MIYLSRKQEVIMTNTSNVSLSYNWDILEFENLHRPITAQRSFIKTALPFDRQKSVFTISPNSGSIKAGQSERFVVEFRPDDMRQLKGIGSKSCYVIITSLLVNYYVIHFFGFSNLPKSALFVEFQISHRKQFRLN